MNEFKAQDILSLFQAPGWYVGCNLRDEHKDKSVETGELFPAPFLTFLNLRAFNFQVLLLFSTLIPTTWEPDCDYQAEGSDK